MKFSRQNLKRVFKIKFFLQKKLSFPSKLHNQIFPPKSRNPVFS